MECELCQTSGRKKFYCERCLNERLLIHKNALQRLRASLDTRVQNAAEHLQQPGGVQERRNLKAQRDALISNITSFESRQQSSSEQLQSNKNLVLDKRKNLTIRKTRLRSVRSRLQTQQANLNYTSKSHPKPSSSSSCVQGYHHRPTDLVQRITSVQQQWDQILENLSLVRKKLIIQLCGIYTITANYTKNQSITPSIYPNQAQQQKHQLLVEQQQRSRHQEPDFTKKSSVDKINPKLSWQILGLCLPVSTEIKSYHHEQISAATLYTSHLLRLIALYLGIKLPFQMIMGPFLSIRAPINSIWSNKHPTPYPLHIPSSMVYSSGSQVSQVAFLSGLCMLAINVHYLLLTQQPQMINKVMKEEEENNKCKKSNPRKLTSSVNDHTSTGYKPTDLLKNLYNLCCTRPIGIHSHITGKKLLTRPDDPFNSHLIELDELIKEVLQPKIEDSVDEGWSII